MWWVGGRQSEEGKRLPSESQMKSTVRLTDLIGPKFFLHDLYFPPFGCVALLLVTRRSSLPTTNDTLIDRYVME